MRPIDILEDIFTKQISVLNISVPTIIVSSTNVSEICKKNNYDVHLVRDGIGSNLQLFERSTGKTRNIIDHEIISETTPILEVLELLLEYPQAFIKEKSKITRIVSRADLDSIPVRIWLFGMISILEFELRSRIQSTFVVWEQCLSDGRIEYAKNLFREKLKRNEEVELLDCVQIVDLSKIICTNWILFGDYSNKISCLDFRDKLYGINKLRDELAHTQRITLEWNEIYKLMTFARMIIATEPKLEEVYKQNESL